MNTTVAPAAPRVFKVLESKRHAFEKHMVRLARKAAKLGVAAPSYEMGEAVFEERFGVREDGSSYKYTVKVCLTTVTSVVVKIPGWSFIATLQHLEGGENLVRTIGEEPVDPTYRTTGSKCDHCRTARRRNDTYLVRSEAGELKQIGKSCIADFLGHQDPEHLAAVAEWAASIGGSDDEWGLGGGYEEKCATVEDFVTVTVTLARTVGYISKKIAEETGHMTTSGEAWMVLFPYNRDQERDAEKVKAEITDADRAKAAAAIDWILELPETEINDFLHNLRAVVRAGGVERRMAGYAAALTVAYARAMDQIRERAARPESHHIGAVGERLVLTATVHKIVALESAMGYTTHLHVMTDAAGNDLKWFGSSCLCDEGETVTFKATVKKHDEYKGRKQTLLSRCAIYVPKEPKVKKARKVAA